MPDADATKIQAKTILDALVLTPFERCQPLSREFSTIPTRLGLYAVRHQQHGLLYVGKTKNLKERVKSGHKAFLWSWLDRYNADDVRIAVFPLPYQVNSGLLLELETLILQSTRPPYNALIARDV